MTRSILDEKSPPTSLAAKAAGSFVGMVKVVTTSNWDVLG